MVNWTRLRTRKETVSYLRPPPIPQPRVLDDEPEARVWDAGENPKMYAAIGGGGRRASVEKGYY